MATVHEGKKLAADADPLSLRKSWASAGVALHCAVLVVAEIHRDFWHLQPRLCSTFSILAD